MLHAHKYAVHFDILPEITYLDEAFPELIADLLPLFRGFPEEVSISQRRVDEGLDFCRVIFWAFSESPEAIKTFGIWFQAIFREAQVSGTLERLVAGALEEAAELEVVLTDWTRLHATEAEIDEAIRVFSREL